MSRTSLITISDNHLYNTELTFYERGMILENKVLRASSREITKTLNCFIITVKTIIQKHSKRQNDKFKSRFKKS